MYINYIIRECNLKIRFHFGNCYHYNSQLNNYYYNNYSCYNYYNYYNYYSCSYYNNSYYYNNIIINMKLLFLFYVLVLCN